MSNPNPVSRPENIIANQITKENAKEMQAKGVKKRRENQANAIARRNMRDTAKYLLNLSVSGQTNHDALSRFGITDHREHTYQTAVLVKLLTKAISDGDTSAIRLLGEMTGDLNKYGQLIEDTIDKDSIIERPTINIPNNGRDNFKRNVIEPQAGAQTKFMSTDADICIYGGAAGGGKTFALLLECIRHKDVKGFGAVLFRENNIQITAEGGLWDTSQLIYNQIEGAISKKTPSLQWIFPSGAKIGFAHLDREEDVHAWQGSQICLICFDELTHFSQSQFIYMLSRNRSVCGVAPYVRATCNPDADSWVAKFIAWWIDQDTGYPIMERSGVVRYMCVKDNKIYQGASKEELIEKYGVEEIDCKSITFIASTVYDNKALLETNPQYLSNLKSLTEVDKERLLFGNWKIKASSGKYFTRAQIKAENLLTEVPKDIIKWVRAWDLAATEEGNGDADYTSGVLIGKRKDGRAVILDVINVRLNASNVEELIKSTSKADRAKYGFLYTVRIPQDPGQAGKDQAQHHMKMLSGYDVKIHPITGSKETRATPFAAQWQHGNVDVLIAEWNDEYFSQMESFPESKHDDMVDASSDAFNELMSGIDFSIDNLI